MSARDEALKAIEHVEKMLVSDEQLGPLSRKLVLATLDHAKVCLSEIQELKRARRAPKETTV